jgi:hypothetical protein
MQTAVKIVVINTKKRRKIGTRTKIQGKATEQKIAIIFFSRV